MWHSCCNGNENAGVNESLLKSNQQHLIYDESSNCIIKDPHISQTKGRKKESEKESQVGRFKSGLELSISKSLVKWRACKSCGEYGHIDQLSNKWQLGVSSSIVVLFLLFHEINLKSGKFIYEFSSFKNITWDQTSSSSSSMFL